MQRANYQIASQSRWIPYSRPARLLSKFQPAQPEAEGFSVKAVVYALLGIGTVVGQLQIIEVRSLLIFIFLVFAVLAAIFIPSKKKSSGDGTEIGTQEGCDGGGGDGGD